MRTNELKFLYKVNGITEINIIYPIFDFQYNYNKACLKKIVNNLKEHLLFIHSYTHEGFIVKTAFALLVVFVIRTLCG